MAEISQDWGKTWDSEHAATRSTLAPGPREKQDLIKD